MSIIGKILAVFNFVAVVGFVYIVAVDYGKRHAWTYSVFRHQLVVDGLPVSDDDFDAIENVSVVDKLSDPVVDDIFKSVGGRPIKTQRDEVKRVQSEVRSQIDGTADDKAKRVAMLRLLTPLARNSAERDALAALINDEKVPVQELMTDVDSLFAMPPIASNKLQEMLLPKDERAAIAHLLFSLAPDLQAFSRVQVVVGLRAFNEAANRSAQALRTMSDQTRVAMLQDRANFAVAHHALEDDVRERAELWTDRILFRDNQIKVKGEHQKLLESRQKEIEEVRAQMEAARAAHQKILQDQAKEEEAIFQAQRKFRDTKAENERLERDIRSLERVGTEEKKP